MIFSYSKLLVVLQFFIIFLLLILNNFIFSYPFSLLISSFGLIFGIYTLFFNKVGNFNITPDIKEDSLLIKKGAYKYIRHPMYSSVLLIILGVALTNINIINTLLFIALIIVLYLKAKREETLWSKESEDYKEYKSKTKMFVPFIF